MFTAAAAFLLSLVVSLALTPLVRDYAIRRGVLDQATSSRKIHDRPIPRLGGIAIVLAFFAPFLALLVVESGVGNMFYESPRSAFGILFGGFLIAALGVFDDLRGSGAGKKFAVQFAVAGLLYYLGFRIDNLANPFGETIQLGALGLPFTLLWIVGVINAMNLIDGLDGLAGGVALFAVGTTFVISFNQHNPLMLLFTAALGGAILGFLVYNFNPATVFMGDTGSMFLGFILAASSIRTSQKSTTAVAILTPIVALGLPIVDTLLAIARRAVRGRPLFSADKEHIHHRLISKGLTHRQAAIALYVACLVLNGVAVALIYANSTQTAIVLGMLAIGTYLAMYRLGYIQFNTLHYLSDQRRRNRKLRARVREIDGRLKDCADEGEIWEIVKGFAEDVGACWISLSRKLQAEDETWETKHAGAHGRNDSLVFASTFEHINGRYGGAMLELAWDDGRVEMDRDEEIALESLVERIAEAFARVSGTRPVSALRATTAEIMRNPLMPSPLRQRFGRPPVAAKPSASGAPAVRRRGA